MARNQVQSGTGFVFNYTDLGKHCFPPEDDCLLDSTGWTDLDGDGCVDFVCIGTQSGDYEDTDHEVVAIHVPSGQAMYRVMQGQASKKLALVGGVVVVSCQSGNRLMGLDARSGQARWNTGLDDALEEDGFDGANRAPAIGAIGNTHAVLQLVDDTSCVVDVRDGQIVKRWQGKVSPVGWNLPAMVACKDSDDNIEIFDIARNRTVVRLEDPGQVMTVQASGYFGFMHRGENRGDYCTKVSMFDQNGAASGIAWVKGADGDAVNHGEAMYGQNGAMMLGGMRTLICDPYSDDQSAHVVDLKPNGVAQAHPFPPPRPGFQLKALGWCSPVVVGVWQKAKGTERLVAVGYDPQSLQPRWTVEDLGGKHLDNVLHITGHAVLVPKSNDNYYGPTNPCCIVHIDPNNGQKLMEYPVEAADCVGMSAHFLCATSDYFSGGAPVAYDTWNRQRVL